MAKKSGPESEKTRVQTWMERITGADKVYDTWAERFRVKRLEEYYEGRQWSGVAEQDADKKYTINLVYASVETSKPSLLFYKPQIRVEARPGRGDDFGSTAEEQSRLCQETIQTFMDDPDVGFGVETALALHEAYFRFGVVEVGYTADWVDNPNAEKPILRGDGSDVPVSGSDGEPVKQPSKILREGTRERMFVKRIPASDFRVSMASRTRMETNDWIGYCEWHYVQDVKQNPAYKNTDSLAATGVIDKRLRSARDGDDDAERRHGMIRIWKVWDLRTRVKHVIAEGHQKFLVEGQPFKTLPFAVLKFHERPSSFYPLPVVYNWLSPQDEINEIREQQRVHRRRFNRRYLLREGTIEQVELDKIESGEDGVYAFHKGAPGEQPLQPVQDAPLDGNQWNNLAAGKDDFLQVSGITGEARGVNQADTATQASIMDTRARLREGSARTKVGDWIGQIARLMLLMAREHMALPFWIKMSVDQHAPDAGVEAMRVAQLWQQIEADDLGDIDLEVSVDLASLSPVTEDAQRAAWNQILAMLTNPTLVMVLSQSERLLRKTLALYGIRGENEIREIQGMLQQTTAQLQAQQQSSAGGPSRSGGSAPGVASMAGAPSAPGANVSDGQPGMAMPGVM